MVYYLPSRTDDGSTGDDGMLNAQTDGGPLKDNGLTEDGTDNKGRTTGRMQDGQMVQSKKSLIGLSINSDISLKISHTRRLENSRCCTTFG